LVFESTKVLSEVIDEIRQIIMFCE
jgi:hypothetical protein